MTTTITDVDEYIASFPAEVGQRLRSMRDTIHAVAPGVTEAISYGMPAFRSNEKLLVQFGGWKRHIGMYPVPADEEVLEPSLAPYRSTKDALRFPHDRPLPLDLIARVVAMLVARRTASM